MVGRSDVAPSTIPVQLREEGVVVQYLDGREVLYNGVPEPVAGPLRTPPGTETHVLITDGEGIEGAMTYVNDRNTHDEILESTGVGRVILAPGESTTLFPGVTATMDGHTVAVAADHDQLDGRVFVFAEDELREHQYELVPPERVPDREEEA